MAASEELAPASAPAAVAVLASTHVVIDGTVGPGTIVVSPDTGQIAAVHRRVVGAAEFPAGTSYVDHSPCILLPGLVDAHVHIDEPGRTAWEGFWTATRAAAFGGVTTLIDMPLNSIPPTTTVPHLEAKVRAATTQCWVDVGFYGGVIPGNQSDLKALVQRGVRGFKCFLIDSGVDEFPMVTMDDVARAMQELKDEPTIFMFHAEMLPPGATDINSEGNPEEYQTFLKSRPQSLETHAISEVISLSHTAPKLPLHIVHLSASDAIPILHKARTAGVPITAETCFHYLAMAADQIPNGDTRHKCCPPIRDRTNQDVLWNELLKRNESMIQTIVSDHSPCTPDLKLLAASIPGADDSAREDGDFMAAWGGVSSVGFGLPIVWTEGQKRGITIEDVVRWCCVNTARQVGLEGRKGRLAAGWDADIAVFDPHAQWTVDPSTMLFRHKWSPYQGKTFVGMVKETWVRGVKVFDRQNGFPNSEPTGTLLLEPRRHAS